MQRYLVFSFWLLFSAPALAQQNLFNIPSADITPKNKVFYQHQLNLHLNSLESKGHFVYGLGGGWDIGANIVGKGVSFDPVWQLSYNDEIARGAVYPVMLATVQKQLRLDENISLNLGSQLGFNLSDEWENKELNTFNYVLGSYYFMGQKSRVVGGVYHANSALVGNGNHVGVLLGYEVKVAKRWYLMGDWISGNNDAGMAVVGAMFNASKRVQLCAGALLPNPGNDKPFGVVLEINLLGWDLY